MGMTFIEAAQEILERTGIPMHAKDIAEKAIASGILSHVGKTPVQTMSAQLSATVLKGGDTFTKIRPGVFALTKWKDTSTKTNKNQSLKTDSVSSSTMKSLNESIPIVPRELESAVFEKESEEKVQTSFVDGISTNSVLQKKRKRRRKKASKASSSSIPANEMGGIVTVSDCLTDKKIEISSDAVLEKEERGKFEKADLSISSDILLEKGNRRDFETSRKTLNKTEVVEDREKTSVKLTKKNVAVSKQQNTASPLDFNRDEIVDYIEKILRKSSRPIPAEKIVEELEISFKDGITLIEALIMSDSFERERSGRMPRFVRHRGGYALLEREVNSEIVTLENQITEIRSRLSYLAERQILKKLRSMSANTFVQVMIIFLERLGFGSVKPISVKDDNGFYLSVKDKSRSGSFRTAIVLRRDPAEFILTEHEVMELRGTIHHFNAMGGMIFTTGRANEKACEEGQIANLPPVAVIDGETLARELVRLGVGVKDRIVRLAIYDDVFFNKIES